MKSNLTILIFLLNITVFRINLNTYFFYSCALVIFDQNNYTSLSQ